MTNDNIFDEIKKELKQNHIVLYMKGTADFPQCGFSSMVVGILQNMELEFKDINVLANPELRQAIKDFADWPTIPQLYVDGEFIGGCDIIRDLHESGELGSILKKSNLQST